VVEYSLDQVTWHIAFVLPKSGSVTPQSVLNVIQDMTLNEYNSFITQQYNGTVNLTNINAVLESGASRIERNFCSAAKVLASIFVRLVNDAKQAEHENYWRDQAAGAGFAAGVIGLFLVIASGPVGWVAAGSALFFKIALAGAAVGAAAGAATLFETMKDDMPDLSPEDAALIACYIYRNTQGGTTGRTGIQMALYANYADLPPIDSSIAAGFASMFANIPELYSHWLTMLTDAEVVPCECGGCIVLDGAELTPVTAGNANAPTCFPLLTGGMRSTPTRAPYVPTNFKYLSALYTLPEPYINNQVDSLRANFITTKYGVQSGLSWGSHWVLAMSISGPFAQGATYYLDMTGINALGGAGVRAFGADFTNVTLAHGVSAVSFSMRTNYASSNPSDDINCDTVLTHVEICLRGP
jgi:hypothetical protein